MAAERLSTEFLMDVLRYIRTYRRKYKNSPARADIARRFPAGEGKQRSNAVVDNWLNVMEAEGMIDLINGKPVPKDE